MPILVRILILLNFIFHSTVYSQSSESSSNFYNEGERLAKTKPRLAFQSFERAIELAEKNNDWTLYLRAINAAATLNFKDLEKEETQVFKRVKEALQTPGINSQQLRFQKALLHYHAGEFYLDLTNEVDSAIYNFNSAIDILKSTVGEENEYVAACYHGLGDVYKYFKFEFFEAEKCYEKALDTRQRIKFDDQLTLAKNYYNLATTNRSQEDFEKAIAYGLQTIELTKKVNDLELLEKTYNMVANIYSDIGNSPLAIDYYQKAVQINLATKSNPEYLATYYQGLGITYMNDTLISAAITNFSKAINIYKGLKDLKDKLLLIHCLRFMADAYLLEKNYSAAFSEYKEMESRTKLLGMMKGRQGAEVYLGFGNYYESKNLNDSALYYYQKALTAAITPFKSMDVDNNPTEEMIGTNYYLFNILMQKALVLRRKYSTSKNQKCLQQSLSCLVLAEKIMSQGRNALDIEESKQRFLALNYNVYEQIISTLHEMAMINPNDSIYKKVFHYFELSKARTLIDGLIRAQTTDVINQDDNLFKRQNELTRSVSSVQDKLYEEQEASSPDSIQIMLLREEIISLDQLLKQNQNLIAVQYPGYFKLRYDSSIPTLSSIIELSSRQGYSILEYFWGERDVYALAISSDQLMFKRIGTADSLGRITHQLLSHFDEEHSSLNINSYAHFTSSAHQLYEKLVSPFDVVLQKNQRLVIIPDGLLSQVPFDILITDTPRTKTADYRSIVYMIKRYAIGYAYSSATLFNKISRPNHTKSVLAMAFTGERIIGKTGKKLTKITGAEMELVSLQHYFDSGNFLVGKDVTESNFKKLAPTSDIIHLAIHGEGDPERNYSSSLYFETKHDTKEDGQLHAYELYGLKLNAMLTVLSACESGLGKVSKGEGMMSMSSAFAYSGCENILMSLWKVNDQISAQLMKQFYNNLLQGENLDMALRNTKLEYLASADELTADPKIWASLAAYGNLNPVFSKDRSKTYYYIFGGCCLLVLLLYLWKRNMRMMVKD